MKSLQVTPATSFEEALLEAGQEPAPTRSEQDATPLDPTWLAQANAGPTMMPASARSVPAPAAQTTTAADGGEDVEGPSDLRALAQSEARAQKAQAQKITPGDDPLSQWMDTQSAGNEVGHNPAYAAWQWPRHQVRLAFASPHGPQLREAARQTPRLVQASGPEAAFRYLEFFSLLSNTRAYRQAVEQFLLYCDPLAHTLLDVAPYLVSSYIEQSPLSIPSRKQHLAAVRRLFGHLVAQHVLPLNPALPVRGPKYSQARGKTPALTAREARQLLDSIETGSILGLRDRALIGVMVYSFARVGAVVKLAVGDYFPAGKVWWLRLQEKGGKLHEVPAHHNVEKYLDEYIEAAGIRSQHKVPLFRSLPGRAPRRETHEAESQSVRERYLVAKEMDTNDVLRMIKRRAEAAGLSTRIGCHTFRATGITVFLQNGGTLEKAQQIAAHASPKTTKLYDRSNDALSLDEIERVLI